MRTLFREKRREALSADFLSGLLSGDVRQDELLRSAFTFDPQDPSENPTLFEPAEMPNQGTSWQVVRDSEMDVYGYLTAEWLTALKNDSEQFPHNLWPKENGLWRWDMYRVKMIEVYKRDVLGTDSWRLIDSRVETQLLNSRELLLEYLPREVLDDALREAQ